MKKILSLCLLAALFCSCSVLSTTADTTVRDSKDHPLAGYKYFHVYSDAQLRETTSSSHSENGSSSTSHSIYTDDPGEYVSGFMMKKGYIAIPAETEGYPKGTVLISCAKSGGGFWKSEATVQFLDGQTRALLMTVTQKASTTPEAVFRCMEKAFELKKTEK